jgi:signal transduction histidine kinase
MQTTILIVDDIPENISTLFHFLDANHFEVLVARDGESALELIEYEQPSLILLDIMMPGIDGFETCKRLKANAKTQDIPIIFMTALSETVDKLKGFKLGAVDYITKPIRQEEVLARINIHLTICNLQQQLKVKNVELEAKNVELEAKNVELEAKNAELDAFSHTVAHDLKNPLAHMITLSDFLLEELPSDVCTEGQDCLQHIFNSSKKMIGIVDALLLLANVSKEEVELNPLNMGDIIHQAQQRLTAMLEEYQGEIIMQNKWPIVVGYAPWIEEIWVNYLSNGLKYSGNPPHLELGATENQKTIRFWVRDNGSGLSQEALAKLFTPFTRLHKTKAEGHGLGLSIVQRIVSRFGGEVGVESQPDQGSVFYFTLPSIPQN